MLTLQNGAGNDRKVSKYVPEKNVLVGTSKHNAVNLGNGKTRHGGSGLTVVGSKAHCISELLKKGYAKECVLMVGDAPGDLAAAEENGVAFYPVLVRFEKESWERLPALLQSFVRGEAEESLVALRKKFFENLQA